MYPIIFFNNNAIVAKGLQKTAFQFQPSILITKAVLRSMIKVPISGAKVGNFLISRDFETSLAVVAELKDCFAVYHANSALSKCKGFDDFIAQVKGKTQSVWIFEKDNLKHRTKASALAVELGMYLMGHDIYRIRLYETLEEAYSTIIICNKQIILTNKVRIIKDEDMVTDHRVIKSSGYAIAMEQGISIKQSALELQQNQKEHQLFPMINIPLAFLPSCGS